MKEEWWSLVWFLSGDTRRTCGLFDLQQMILMRRASSPNTDLYLAVIMKEGLSQSVWKTMKLCMAQSENQNKNQNKTKQEAVLPCNCWVFLEYVNVEERERKLMSF